MRITLAINIIRQSKWNRKATKPEKEFFNKNKLWERKKYEREEREEKELERQRERERERV